MRVAYINSVAGYGSTGRLIEQLTGMEGLESIIYYGRKSNMSKQKAVRITETAGNMVHVLNTRLFDLHGFCNTRETYHLIEHIKSFRPDLIHLHNLHGYYMNVEVLFRFLQQVSLPVAWTLHDCWAFTGHCAHYEAIECKKWQTLCHNCTQLQSYYKTMSRSGVKRNYLKKEKVFTSLGERLHIAVPSQWLKRQVSQSFLKDTECTVISNGIDLGQFYPVESSFKKDHGIENKKVILACSSIWTDRKGLDQLADISFHLPENAVLCVIGVTKKQAESFSSETICIERTDSIRKLAEIYSAGDLFVNPTLEETFSLVNVEAQACGCPVCTYRSGGSTEMISDKTGIVIGRNNIDGMLKAIRDVCEEKKTFRKENCIANAGLFSVERMQQGYMDLYRRVLKERI